MSRFVVRQLVFGTTAVFGMMFEHPRAFLFKLSERCRAMNFPGAQTLSRSLRRISGGQVLIDVDVPEPTSENLDLLTDREVEKAIQLLRGMPETGRFDRIHTDVIRPLMLLNNAAPYTKSGYTLRSQKLLAALRKSGVPAFAVTRIGYPTLVGRLAESETTLVDDVPYRHIIPLFQSRSLLRRETKAVKAIEQIADENQVNILHTTTDFKNAYAVASAARKLNVPWVYEVRGEPHNTWLSKLPEEERQKAKSSFYYRRAAAQELASVGSADAVIVLSEVSRQQWIRRGVAAEKLYVVPNSIDAELLELSPGKTSNESQARDEKVQVIGTVTSVVSYEGLDLILEAVQSMDGVEGLVVGDGADLPRLRDRARQLGITDRMTFVGYRPHDEIVDWYKRIDVFVMPRIDSPVCRNVTPIKGLMAQALGLPVVATDLPALREVTGGIGFYFEPGNLESFIGAIRKALTLDSERIASKSRRWASTRTWGNAAEQLVDIYSDLLTIQTRTNL